MTIKAGINIFSVYRELGEDYFGTLQKVAEAGYENIELIGFNMKSFTRYIDEIPMESLRDKCRELGLTAIAVHEGAQPGADLLANDWDGLMSYYGGIGCERIVLPSVWISNQEDTLRTAEQMNQIGKKMKDNGFRFYLHNHAHEFKSIGNNETLFDVLLENTDPAYLKFEVDLAWVMRAGLDPVQVLTKLGDRCDMIHQKDLAHELKGQLNILEAAEREGDNMQSPFEAYQKYVGPQDFVDLGTGRFDFAGVYEQIRSMGHVRYALVENEGESADKFASIRQDLEIIRKYI